MDYASADWMTLADTFSRHDQQSVTVINRWNWNFADHLTLRSGIDYRFIHVDSTETSRHSRHDGGVYLTAEFQPARQFLIIPSVKAVFANGGTQKITAIPKLGLLWNVTDSFSLKNNYFRSFKLPDFNDLYWPNDGFSTGNPDLRPEDGWGADIGAEWRITELIKLESVFFVQWMKDMIAWQEVSPWFYRAENVDKVIFFGLDSKFSYEIPVDFGPVKKIIHSLSYQYLLSYISTEDYSFASKKRFPYSPEHTFGGSVEILWESGSLLLSGHYEGLRYVNNHNSAKLDSHFLLNATVNQKIGGKITVFGSLRNILNESYESVSGGYPMPGVSLTIGLRANFNAERRY
jgi:vitamin B12 transporter